LTYVVFYLFLEAKVYEIWTFPCIFFYAILHMKKLNLEEHLRINFEQS